MNLDIHLEKREETEKVVYDSTIRNIEFLLRIKELTAENPRIFSRII